jgi:hypothetical protein
MRENSIFDIKPKPFSYPEMEERILQNHPEIVKYQEETDIMDIINQFQDAMMENLKSAVDKEFVSDLTEDETSAICYYTGAKGTWVDGRLRFENCQLYKRDGKWGVYQYDR